MPQYADIYVIRETWSKQVGMNHQKSISPAQKNGLLHRIRGLFGWRHRSSEQAVNKKD